ncbi:MAG: aminotransferase class V-fold PLP-dependent enzyme [Candidatus Aminicenantes bacterium]|nr:aminotransferase class V-fold PLP-dependent enzyme [Candidatus Aminicenantes bacterium]
MHRVYMDHIAGTPVHPDVMEAMLPFLKDSFGNPQNMHSFGQAALQGLDKARAQVAALIHADPSEIYFTSSGSESNNFALKGLVWANRKKGNHFVVSAIEHMSILNTVKALAREGYTSTVVPVDKWGQVDPEEVRKAIKPETTVVSIMLANSEVGTIEPITQIAGICNERGVVFHSDGVAAVGVVPVDVQALGVQALSLAGNQFYGPRGSAALYVRKGTKILPLIDGGIQENGKRAGSENTAGIVGMGQAAELAQQNMDERIARIRPLRDRIIQHLSLEMDHVVLTGHPKKRLPYHASFCVAFVEGEALLLSLDMQGVAVSSGSACSSKSLKASHVLLAMDVDIALAQGSLVFSLIESLTEKDVQHFLEVFPPIIDRLRKMSPLYTEYLEEKGK